MAIGFRRSRRPRGASLKAGLEDVASMAWNSTQVAEPRAPPQRHDGTRGHHLRRLHGQPPAARLLVFLRRARGARVRMPRRLPSRLLSMLPRRPPKPLLFSGLRGQHDGSGQAAEARAVAALPRRVANRPAQLGRRRAGDEADRLRDRRRNFRRLLRRIPRAGDRLRRGAAESAADALGSPL